MSLRSAAPLQDRGDPPLRNAVIRPPQPAIRSPGICKRKQNSWAGQDHKARHAGFRALSRRWGGPAKLCAKAAPGSVPCLPSTAGACKSSPKIRLADPAELRRAGADRRNAFGAGASEERIFIGAAHVSSSPCPSPSKARRPDTCRKVRKIRRAVPSCHLRRSARPQHRVPVESAGSPLSPEDLKARFKARKRGA